MENERSLNGTRGNARIDNDRAGDTSHGCGNSPAASSFIDGHPITYDAMVSLLKQNGFGDAETPQTRFLLERVSFQHIEHYLAVAKRYFPNAGVKTAHDLLQFDRRFQSILLKYIGMFEMQLRAQYAYKMNESAGEHCLYDPGLFLDYAKYARTMETVGGELRKRAKHSKRLRSTLDGNGGKAPVWHAVECMSLGNLSKLYSNTKDVAVTHSVADSFGVKRDELTSWLACLTAARNSCAHYDCLAFRKQLSTPPKRIRGVDCPNTIPFYTVFLLEKVLSTNRVFDDDSLHYSSDLATEIVAAIADFRQSQTGLISAMRLPENWFETIFSDQLQGIHFNISIANGKEA
jgi:abortive infection bacteriophage resistance protein